MNWKDRAHRFTRRKGDRLNAIRRRIAMSLDQGIALASKKVWPISSDASFDGNARFGLVSVNFSTTRYLKLMLLTLMEQEALHRIARIILVDNDSRDGGIDFCRRLASASSIVHLVENRFWVNHARGLRSGVAALDRVEAGLPDAEKSNVLLACDTDVIFLSPDTLDELARPFESDGAIFAGELRHGLYPYPEAQASFFALRRDAYAQRNIRPFVHHGAPAYWTQRSLWRAGHTLTDFPANREGYTLHRGRSAVAAAREYRPRDAYATAPDYQPHFMGVADGEVVWHKTEQRFSDLLATNKEHALVEHLASRLPRP